VLDRCEGWVNCEIDMGKTIWHGFEEGRALMLGVDGNLRSSEYRIRLLRRFDQPGETEQHTFDGWSLALPDTVLSYDRINHAEYREVRRPRSSGPGHQVAWRRELGRRFQIRVRNPGMETSLALKALKERGAFKGRLEINH